MFCGQGETRSRFESSPSFAFVLDLASRLFKKKSNTPALESPSKMSSHFLLPALADLCGLDRITHRTEAKRLLDIFLAVAIEERKVAVEGVLTSRYARSRNLTQAWKRLRG